MNNAKYQIHDINEKGKNQSHCANIGLHLREEKEILAQRRTERMVESQSQKVSLGTIKKKKKTINDYSSNISHVTYRTNTSVSVGLLAFKKKETKILAQRRMERQKRVELQSLKSFSER